ncbi:branched-chain amino acid ABC transporter permease [Halopenitus sp. POP-27]|uniref:branched-chain amino acid ABC transporter permease n=1 Tax=Halopenitus sp. POP-27 TaxID=2994425 RepID=UPI002468FBF0|nr:branched-chain amino acid ABC transporter permease [Halopenitus sp. POP-27]
MVATNTLIAVGIDGIAYGMFLALLGVGITLVFGLGEVLNLAIGMFAILGTLMAHYLSTTVGLGSVPAFILGVGLVGILGVAVDRTLLSLVYRSDGEERILLGIFVTLGLSILLEGTLTNFFPSRYSLSLGLPRIDVIGITIPGSSILVITVSAVVLVALFAFLRGTFLGKAARTVFQDEVGALLIGVDPRRIRAIVFVLATIVAGIAGVVYGTSATLGVTSGFQFTIFALIVSIVGGIRSIEGTAVAGILLGIVATYANFFIGAYLASIILFMTAVIILLVRPVVGE